MLSIQKQTGLIAAIPPEKVTSEGSLQFSGDGFLKYKLSFSTNAFREISFKFKTKQKNALLLFGEDQEFSRLHTSFEVVNGRLVYRFDPGYGKGEVVYTSKFMVNDGKVHSIVKTRTELKVDDVVMASFDQVSQELSARYLFIGGVPFGKKMPSR